MRGTLLGALVAGIPESGAFLPLAVDALAGCVWRGARVDVRPLR